jgi:hypothetical protein
MGQSTAASGVKFWLGPSSVLGEKVTSGLVWRFGTFDCVSDNLAHFENGFGNSGSFLNIGSHRFYVAKPFPEEVTDILDSLCDGGSSCGEISNLGAMVEVMALGEEEGGNSPRPEHPLPERLLPQEQDAPLPEQVTLDVSVVDLHAPLSHVIDPAQVAEALERTRLVLLSKVAEDQANRCRASTTLSEFYDVHGDALTELAPDLRRSFATVVPGQIQQSPSVSRGRRGRGQGGRAPGDNAQGHCTQQGGGASRLCQIPVAVPGLESQAHHRRCTSTCGLTTPRCSPEDLLAQSEQLLTKVARGLPAAVMGASTPSMLHLISRVSSTPPQAGKRLIRLKRIYNF